MAERNSRKRSVPARLREETWYLVDYEDDGNLRVLGEDEIRHIFPDEEEEIQAGDIVSALWLPNGQFYDAKVLQKYADKNELMRERLQLEKAKKNKEKTTKTTQDPKLQQKRKNHKDFADQQKKKKKTKVQSKSDREMQQKEKEKEEKKQKKMRNKQGKNFY